MKLGIVILVIGLLLVVTGSIIISVKKNEKSEKSVMVFEDTASETCIRSDTVTPKQKGNDFENWMADILKASHFRLLEWNQGTTSPEGAYAKNELNPDFLVLQNAGDSDLCYWIECKYRSSLSRKGFYLKDYQLDRYRKIQKKTKCKIVIALGVGGRPDYPDKFYIIPLDTIVAFKRIGHKYLPNYSLDNPRTNFAGHMSSWFFNEVFQK